MKLSVIICTHNPRVDYLQRVLEGLRKQTIPAEEWELLLIDNASREPLAAAWDLSWHPHARCIREEALGVVHARLCGIEAARGEVMVFVDDDNVLDPDYLENMAALAVAWPMLGVWSGSLIPEFEETPARHLEPFLHNLALREVTHDIWGNPGSEPPMGAGMGMRALVAQAYLEIARKDPVRLSLGRRGDSLMGGEDKDMAAISYDMGFGTGIFRQLRLTHLIPKRRLTEDYILRLIRGNEASFYLENILRKSMSPPAPSRIDRLVILYKYWMGTPWQRRIHQAREAGKRDAQDFLATLEVRP